MVSEGFGQIFGGEIEKRTLEVFGCFCGCILARNVWFSSIDRKALVVWVVGKLFSWLLEFRFGIRSSP